MSKSYTPLDGGSVAGTVGSDPMGWWTDGREQRWEELNEVRKIAVERYREHLDGYVTPFSILYVCAPNPFGINADISPNKWYFSSGGEMIEDPKLMQNILEEESGETIQLEEQSKEWEDGYWFIAE